MINNLCVGERNSDMQIDTIKESIMPPVLVSRQIKYNDEYNTRREEKQSDSSSEQ